MVYCEMQARENSGESRTHLEMLRAMYPGHCGYRSETGGIMKNLRESCSHTKVGKLFFYESLRHYIVKFGTSLFPSSVCFIYQKQSISFLTVSKNSDFCPQINQNPISAYLAALNGSIFMIFHKFFWKKKY